MAKKGPHTRDSVFKGHVFDRLYPSERKKDDGASNDASGSLKELTGIVLSKSAASSQLPSGKVYTVRLPPEGLPDTQTLTSCKTSHGNISSESDSSASESVDDAHTVDEANPPRKRKRKRRHGQKVLGKDNSLQILPTSSTSCTVNTDDVDLSRGTSSGTCGDAQRSDISLTKNQRKKLRKRRAKRGRLQERSTGQASEFVCDKDDKTALAAGCEESTEELMGFLESVWSVFRSDRSKLEVADSLTQSFQVLMEQLADDHLPRDIVHRCQKVQQLMVLQDFERARLELTELQESQESSPHSDCISILSALAEYWMTDIHCT